MKFSLEEALSSAGATMDGYGWVRGLACELVDGNECSQVGGGGVAARSTVRARRPKAACGEEPSVGDGKTKLSIAGDE